ncbi:hypothetical protein CFI11_13205 [Thalassococcus sp. S3]|nr:hypothetical protein CFI11_13205 [Thalassococcus sp. S3]
MLKANLANSRNPLNEYLQRLGPPRESANCVRDECANLIVRKRMKYGAKSKVVVPHFQLSRELLDLLEAIDFARRKMPEKTFKAFRDLICEPINDATPKEAYDYGPTYHLARIAFKHRASHRYNFDDFKADIEALHTKANTFDPKASSNPVSGQSVGYPDSGHPLGYPVSGQPDLITGPSKEVGTEGLKTECGQAAPTSVSTEEIFQAVDVGKDTLSDNEKLKVQEAASQAKKEAAQDAKHAALMAKYKKSGAKA